MSAIVGGGMRLAQSMRMKVGTNETGSIEYSAPGSLAARIIGGAAASVTGSKLTRPQPHSAAQHHHFISGSARA
jgi:hypothetical protein